MVKKKKKKRTKDFHVGLKELPQQIGTQAVDASKKGSEHWWILMILVFSVGILATGRIPRTVEVSVAVFGCLIIFGYMILLARRRRARRNITW